MAGRNETRVERAGSREFYAVPLDFAAGNHCGFAAGRGRMSMQAIGAHALGMASRGNA